ncbi:hypothetical protein SEUCBS139899_009327 [Sporothrix eucalyptigena]|uniref:Protein kinase domain-containing protein n=1 Tax=Sporothrix eucalyptigena TaxID=1812306 RepID=A0ABP0AXP3_9PEZI
MTDAEIAEDVLYQMALALKFLARYKMVHRDIKPANILYETRLQADGISSYYHFQLADFNLSNESASARTFAGTQTFMAPEVYDRKLQSCNADIWSLFVTIVWIHNVDDFRSYITEDKIQLRDKITEISQQAMFANICDMAIQDPKYRVSARDLVSRLEGTSTRMPPTASGSTVTSMTQGPSGNEQGDASFTFVPYISDEIARGFSSNFSSRPTIGSSSMNGQSALGEFSGVAGPSTTTIYHNGRINEDYGYQYPRNEDVMADGEAAFAATTEDVPEGDGEEGGGEGEGVRYGHAYLY